MAAENAEAQEEAPDETESEMLEKDDLEDLESPSRKSDADDNVSIDDDDVDDERDHRRADADEEDPIVDDDHDDTEEAVDEARNARRQRRRGQARQHAQDDPHLRQAEHDLHSRVRRRADEV